jgi:hypothetical protein
VQVKHGVYWESADKTPDKEIIRFEFPEGSCHRYETPSVKFSEYTAAKVEREESDDTAALLRAEVTPGSEERRALAKTDEGAEAVPKLQFWNSNLKIRSFARLKA